MHGRVALFVPCYIDQLYPQVAVATLRVLERLGCEVVFPQGQTCCGQPMANAGFDRAGLGAMANFVRCFADYDAIVAPSASCVAHVREHYDVLESADPERAVEVQRVRASTYELCEFLTGVLEVDRVDATFPHRVGLHHGCHGLRGLGLARPSERQEPRFDRVRSLLEQVEGLNWRFMDQARQWQASWPPRDAEGKVTEPLPLAVELTLQLKPWGEVRRLIRLAREIGGNTWNASQLIPLLALKVMAKSKSS